MTRIAKTLGWGLPAFLLVLLVDWGNGTFRSEFGRYADEGMHYVTGLLIRDYFMSGSWDIWTHPMRFALDYYSHLPKVALGNWPPVFEILQAVWELFFGVSRASLMLQMAVFTAALATVVFRSLSSRMAGRSMFLRAAAVAALIAAPLTQAQTAMVMAEVPLALFSFLAVLAWIAFLDTGSNSRKDALAFGCWTTVAILTKGNGWVIPALVAVTIVLLWEWRVLLRVPFWLAVAVISCTCVPYTLLTMGIVVQGWNQQSVPDLPFLVASIGVHHGFIANILGWPLYAVAWAGLLDRVFLPLVRRTNVDRFWSILALYGLAILLFHATVPTSLEPRKIYQIAPVLGVFLAAGLDVLARVLGMALKVPGLAPVGAILIAAFGFWWSGFALIEPFTPGFAPAVANVLEDARSRGTAVLISSNPTFADSEAAIIAEWASRQRNAGTYLLRGTKLLSTLVPVPGTVDFEPYDRSPQDLAARLKQVPVSFVILHTTKADHPYQHHALLQSAMDQDLQDWTPVYKASTSTLQESHLLQIYRYSKDVRGVPINFEIDLSRKLGSPVVTGAGPTSIK